MTRSAGDQCEEDVTAKHGYLCNDKQNVRARSSQAQNLFAPNSSNHLNKTQSLTSLIHEPVDNGQNPVRFADEILKPVFKKIMVPHEHFIVGRPDAVVSRGRPGHVTLEGVSDVVCVREVEILGKVDVLEDTNVSVGR